MGIAPHGGYASGFAWELSHGGCSVQGLCTEIRMVAVEVRECPPVVAPDGGWSRKQVSTFSCLWWTFSFRGLCTGLRVGALVRDVCVDPL